MKKKLLAGLMAAAVALGGCQAPSSDELPPEDSVKEEAADVSTEGHEDVSSGDDTAVGDNIVTGEEIAPIVLEGEIIASAPGTGADSSGDAAGSADAENGSAASEGENTEVSAGEVTEGAYADSAGEGTEEAEGETADSAGEGMEEAEGGATDSAVEGMEEAEGGAADSAGEGMEEAEGGAADSAGEGMDEAESETADSAGEGMEEAEDEPADSDAKEGEAIDSAEEDKAEETAADEITGSNPKVQDLEKQIAVIVDACQEWIHFCEEDDPYRCMAVTDLDGNGRLEIVVGASWSGQSSTFFDMWEVKEDLSSLAHVESDFAEDASLPDLLGFSAFDFYTDEGGRHYLTYDYRNVSGNENEQELVELTLKDGRLTHKTVGSLRTVYGNENTETGAGPNGEAITSDQFWSLASDLIKGEKGDKSAWISWLMLPRADEPEWSEDGIRIRTQGSWQNFLVGTDVLTVMFAGIYDGDEDTVIINPGEGPSYAGETPAVLPLTLDILSETGNEITDTDAWFERNSLEKPGESLGSARWQAAINKKAGTLELMKDGNYDCLMDLCSFCTLPEESGEIGLRYAVIDGDIIYVSVSRKPYTDQDYGTGFIVAIDLNEKTLIWKSDSLVAGAFNFIVRDGRIFTGYGATGEDDFLYQIDQATGRTLDSVKLATAPDYILAVDDVLYVRTYNTDYTFSLAG